MRTYLWMAAVVLGAAPAWAQPDDKGAMAPSNAIAVAALEKAIGGRTTLELKFQDLTSEQVAEAVGKSSGLRFVAPSLSPSGAMRDNGAGASGRRVIVPRLRVPGVTPSVQPEVAAATWNGDVDKTDFWPGLRGWVRAENLRFQRESAALRKRQAEEISPFPAPEPVAGEKEITANLMAEWRKKQSEWSQRRMAEQQRFASNQLASASYDVNREAWRLVAGGELSLGRAVNSWPCLILATKFQRQQNLLLQEDEPEKVAEKSDAKTTSAKAPVEKTPIAINKEPETLVGGVLTDTLFLGLSVYVEPKLQQRAKVNVLVKEARDDAGEDLLLAQENGSRAPGYFPSGFFSGGESAISSQIQLRPRQATGHKLAVLRGVVVIRYPLQLQEHEITDFAGTQNFLLNTNDLPVTAQFEPPHLENGQLLFSTSLKLESARGGGRIIDNLNSLRQSQNPGRPITRSNGASIIGGGIGLDAHESLLGRYLMPNDYTFIDTQGRTWYTQSVGGEMSLSGPDGRPIPVTSPPTLPPDNFTYIEKHKGSLRLLSPNPAMPNTQAALTPAELASVRFTKATFTTESDWRTLEVPFEFHDLPLPPR